MSGQKQRHGIITGGTWCADHNKLVERWPNEEELVEIISEEIRGGGSACNLGVNIKRLDPELPVATIGLLGDDSDGNLLLQQAKFEGLDCQNLTIVSGQRTTFTDAFTAQNSSRRTHLFHSGISDKLNPNHFDFSDVESRILHLGLPGLHAQMDVPWAGEQNGWAAVLKKAQTAGLRTNLELCSLSPKRLNSLVTPCLKYLDYLIINEFEIAAVAGQPRDHIQNTDINACILNAKKLLNGTDIQLIIVHFPLGAVAVSQDGNYFLAPSVNMPSDSIIGTNGAGDAFAAGALYGLHQNWSVEETLRIAHATAAASMRHIGTTDGVVGWSECIRLASEFGWHNQLH
jgi:sugar/nucleoside kinase (ribokinase family)